MTAQGQDWDKHYQVVDSLIDRSLPESAQKYFNQQIRDKVPPSDRDEYLKMDMYQLVLSQIKAEGDTALIHQALAKAAGTQDQVHQAIWQSIAAFLLQQYYYNHRYEIIQRTGQNTVPDDFQEWSSDQFYDQIAGLYHASLVPAEQLKRIAVKDYSAVLTKSEHTEDLRPTLFDILAYRANQFFSNAMLSGIEPLNEFNFNDQALFSSPEDFVRMDLAQEGVDSNAQEINTLKVYQQLIAFHLSQGNTAALIEADRGRLIYVHQKTTDERKDLWMYQALWDLYQRYQDHPAGQIPYVQVLGMLKEQAESKKPPKYPQVWNMKEIAARLAEVNNKYKETEAASMATDLLNVIYRRNIELTLEKELLPGQHTKVRVDYKNIPSLSLTVYQLSHLDKLNLERDPYKFPKISKHWKPVKQWKASLPKSEDLLDHSTEILLEELPAGAYLLVVNDRDVSPQLDQNLSYQSFQVSKMAVIKGTGKKGRSDYYVLDRHDGDALSNVQVKLFQWKYNDRSKAYELKPLDTYQNHQDGSFQMRNAGSQYTEVQYLLSKGADTLSGGDYDYFYDYDRTDEAGRRSLIFTDRSIYRPGQTVLVKGIVYEELAHSEFKALTGQTITLVLRDANEQEVSKVEVKTNEFGSYRTGFTLPEGLLNGVFTISDDWTNLPISVEEYKRPQFLVEFDQMKDSYALNQEIKVKGKAETYSGIGLDQAKVKYRVVRSGYLPYPWLYYKSLWNIETKVIAIGETMTQQDGTFEIPFELLPDPAAKKEDGAIFNYKIYADVTDITGETHQQNVSISAGFDPFTLQTELADQVNLQQLKDARFSVRNLNGQDVDVPVDITISRLAYPGYYRSRLWEQPEIQQYSKEEFWKLFPFDEYADESDPYSWNPSGLVQELKNISLKEGKPGIELSRFKENGFYQIEVVARTADGRQIKDKKIFHLFDHQFGNRSEKELVLMADQNQYEPGVQLNLNIGSVFGAEQPVYLFEGSRDKEWVRLVQPHTYKRMITEEDRGGIQYQSFTVHNNRYFPLGAYITVPWSNKELDIEWASHRDKLQPGDEEQWTMTIKGDKKEQVAAELVSVLYDASLDAIRPHSWSTHTDIYSNYYGTFSWQTTGFNAGHAYRMRNDEDSFSYHGFSKIYADLLLFSNSYWGIASYREIAQERYVGIAGNSNMDVAPAPTAMPPEKKESSLQMAKEEAADMTETDSVTGGTEPQLRTNFQETAYFYPDLKTDEDGNVVLRFTLPEALTQWKMMAYAHTRDMKTGFLEGSIISQKEMMVQPNMPRFFRQNDEVILSAKLSNLSEKDLAGAVWIEMIDPESKLPLEEPFQITKKEHSFSLPEGKTQEYSWTFKVPSDRVEPVLVRIRAQAGNFSDGEEHLVPVLTNRVFVTESMVLSVSGSGEVHYDWEQFRGNQSSSLTHYGYTFEYTANPAWYAVQALPYLMEYPYDCSEQMFNKVYANALAHKIVASHPNIRTTFEQWKAKDTAALVSNLSKNEELKSALLQETPWVLEAQGETEQKHRMASLFEAEKVEGQIRRWITKIRQNQNADGGWPWFQGMRSDEYITQYMLTGWGKLRKMEAFDFEQYHIADNVDKALDFTDREMVRRFEELKRNNKNWQKIASVDHYTLNYMYMRSFFPEKEMSAKVKEVFDFYYSVAKKEAVSLPLLQKSQMAIVAQRNRDVKTAGLLVQSLNETSLENEEMGIYWKSLSGGYYWYDAPVSTQAAIIEAFTEVGGYEQEVEGMKKWLLKQKQTQHWNSTIATADACYALLSRGENWLGAQPDVTVRLGSNQIRITEENAEAGTGYFKKKYEANEVRPEMGDITIKVDQPETAKSRPSWGAVYWQYFEDMDKVTTASGPLNITKQLYIRRNTAKGTELVEWKGKETLKLGDRVTVRVVIRTDRDLEYVHLKDMRAAALEPVDVLSGYQFHNGLGYYRSIADASVHFFFDRIHKGTHVFEYDLFVNASGTYSNGISTIQCLYAPEFGAHTQGQRIYIER